MAYTTAGDNALAAWTSLTNLRTLNLDSCPVSDRCPLFPFPTVLPYNIPSSISALHVMFWGI